MKNLSVQTHLVQNNPPEFCQETLDDAVLCCINPDNDDLYVLQDKNFYAFSSKHGLRTAVIDIETEQSAKPVGLEYCSDVEQLWCAYDSGVIISINAESAAQPEVTTRFSEGLRSMKLSPDQEILVLITADNSVVTTVSDFHVISKVDLNSDEYGRNQFITVGWGKKETQFHGSEGKAAAKTKDVIVGRTTNDDEKPRITWRGNGTMFAASFIRDDGQARLFKVFNREGILQCTSELAAGLEAHIAWKPSGNVIAVGQLLPNKHVIAFFEKNGLKHRELCLPYKPNEIEIISLTWSHDSEILSIWLKENNGEETSLQIWTENNYHWYLKQTIKFTAENPLVYFTWSAAPRAGKRLILLTKKTTMTYSFRWNVDHSRGHNRSDKAVVGVVNGKEVLLTGFRMGIVPPPMAHTSLKFSETINSILFSPGCVRGDAWLDSNTFMCLLSDNRLALCRHDKDSRLLEYNHVRTFDVNWQNPIITDTETYSVHHFLWFKERVILCSASSNMSRCLCVLNLEGEDFENDGRIVVRGVRPMDDPIEHIVSSPDKNVAYVVAGKSVFKYKALEGIEATSLEIPEPCSLVEIIEIENRHIILSLTSRGRFFVDGNEVASNITSFFVHSEFLLLTTLQHSLICMRLDEEGFRQINQDLTVKPWENGCIEKNWSSLSVRRVERGSNLIVAVAEDPRTILQMPRGNLECIQPRALSLHIIRTHLDSHNYREAFDMMRKQRINLNLIYDHDPVSFMENAKKFVDDIENPTWLSLFLSELQDENVTETIYKNYYYNRRYFKDPAWHERKVLRVCDVLREIMESRNDSNFIQPILTSLVKNQQIPGLESALRKIKDIRASEDSSTNAKKSLSEDALRYLLYLVDVNILFDIAMGMYDFELALFVASKSQKDPKEYIPLLNDMKKLEINYMKFTIDKDLKRYDSALNHIAQAPDKFAECFEFICIHDMYAKALRLFPYHSPEASEIAKAYGEALMEREEYHEAAVMFQQSGFVRSALYAYKAAGSWQDVINVAFQLNFSSADLQELYEELAAYLRQEKRYRDAAKILLTYMKQHEDAVSVLCEGKLWREAMSVAEMIKRLDLIETHIKPGVEEHAAYLIFTTNHNREKFEKHKMRLATVSQENAAIDLQQQENLGTDFEYLTGHDVNDLLSDTSSVTGSVSSQSSRSSRSSGRTYRSSKNRRKQERKLLSIKEGSFFEDLALIRALHQIMTMTYADKEEIKLVTEMLLTFEQNGMAKDLQNTFGEFLNLLELSKCEIWPKSNQIGNDTLDTRDEPICIKDNQPSNIRQSLLEPRFMHPPDAGNTEWQLETYPEASAVLRRSFLDKILYD